MIIGVLRWGWVEVILRVSLEVILRKLLRHALGVVGRLLQRLVRHARCQQPVEGGPRTLCR